MNEKIENNFYQQRQKLLKNNFIENICNNYYFKK